MKRNIRQAIELQRSMAPLVRVEPLEGPVRTVAGVDMAFFDQGRQCVAGAVLMSFPDLEVLTTAWVTHETSFPYVPGLLSFREAPAMGEAVKGLCERPDLLLVDGQGLAHPRRLGLACHLGLELDLPSVGCAKSRLIGSHAEVGLKKGSQRRLRDGSEVIGVVLRTRDGVKCLYVSVGHRIELEEAGRMVLKCCGRYRLPEPTREAHKLVSRLREEVAVGATR